MPALEPTDDLLPQVVEGPTGLHVWPSEEAYRAGDAPEQISFAMPDGNIWTWRGGGGRPLLVVRDDLPLVVPVEAIRLDDEVVPESWL